MARKAPHVADYMSRMPVELDRFDSVRRAKEMMASNGIRHIPVMSGSKLYGIVSERDIDVVSAVTAGSNLKLELVDVCTPHPYQVEPTDDLPSVAAEMVKQRIGSAVVVDAEVVVGIITATDMLRALQDAYR